jgi:hypothetical protein
MLHNRQASVRVFQPSGKGAVVELSYDAADAHPAGARIRKRLTLPGDSNLLVVDYEITLKPGDASQSFRAGFASPIAGAHRKASELLLPLAEGLVSKPFEAKKTYAITPEELAARWIALSDPDSGDLLGIFWQNSSQIVVTTQRFSTMVEVVTSPLKDSRPFRFRLGYCFTRNDTGELQRYYDEFLKTSSQEPQSYPK